jgi:hypothetical protein
MGRRESLSLMTLALADFIAPEKWPLQSVLLVARKTDDLHTPSFFGSHTAARLLLPPFSQLTCVLSGCFPPVTAW